MDEQQHSPAGEKLQKVLARMGMASRRDIETWISSGRVQVNGVAATLGQRVDLHDAISVDGRVLRRYRRRWKVERLFAWLQNYRRILVRYDRFLENYLAFVHLACIVIFIRNHF